MNREERSLFRQSSEYKQAFASWTLRSSAVEAFEMGDNDEFYDALGAWRARTEPGATP